MALAPTEAVSYAALAVVLSYMGRTEDALEAAAQALRLKPRIVDAHLDSVGTAYAVAGRYEEALAPLQRYLSRYPNILPAHLMLAAVYSELGQAAEARAEAQKCCGSIPSSHWKCTNSACRSKIQRCWSGILRRCARQGSDNGEWRVEN